MWKIRTKARFTYIYKQQSDFAIWRGFYFHETSHMRSYVYAKLRENKALAKISKFTVGWKLEIHVIRSHVCVCKHLYGVGACVMCQH